MIYVEYTSRRPGCLARDLPQDHAPRRRRLGVRPRRRRRRAHARPLVAPRARARVPQVWHSPAFGLERLRRLGARVPQRRRRRRTRSRSRWRRGSSAPAATTRWSSPSRRRASASTRSSSTGSPAPSATRWSRTSPTAPAATTRRSCACSPIASGTSGPTRAASRLVAARLVGAVGHRARRARRAGPHRHGGPLLGARQGDAVTRLVLGADTLCWHARLEAGEIDARRCARRGAAGGGRRSCSSTCTTRARSTTARSRTSPGGPRARGCGCWRPATSCRARRSRTGRAPGSIAPR